MTCFLPQNRSDGRIQHSRCSACHSKTNRLFELMWVTVKTLLTTLTYPGSQPPQWRLVNLPYDWFLVYDTSGPSPTETSELLHLLRTPSDNLRSPWISSSCYLRSEKIRRHEPTPKLQPGQEAAFVSASFVWIVWFLLSVSLELRCRSLMVQKSCRGILLW